LFIYELGKYVNELLKCKTRKRDQLRWVLLMPEIGHLIHWQWWFIRWGIGFTMERV